eukprot:TRINITY_DN800_c0_g1_i1.p1 TRINITY_DN800_c0_g1~~TRINITY_DN800_c0_g1_i1.p1  ORF type:complete len:322 (-),score=57.92 TRINITY_DN800_c0_g1_i1:106-1071(-)
MNPILENLLEQVNEHKVHYVPSIENKRNPNFVYSCGLSLQGHPDLVIVGINDNQIAMNLMHYFGDSVLNGAILKVGDVLSTPFGVNVKVSPVDLDKCPLVLGGMTSVARYFGVDAFALQLLWNDQFGKFPGEFGCDEFVVVQQWVLDGNSKIFPIKESEDEFLNMSCFHCQKTSCNTALCDNCKRNSELINDGKSHGSTCPDCFKRVQSSSLVGWLNAVDEHNQFCEKNPDSWNPDRSKIDCKIIHPLCKNIASQCYQLQMKQSVEINEIYIFAMLQEEAKLRFNTNLMYLSRITQECLVQKVCQILHKLHQKNLKKSLSF